MRREAPSPFGLKWRLAILAGIATWTACADRLATLPPVHICYHGMSNVYLTTRDEVLSGPAAQFGEPEVTIHNSTPIGQSVVLVCQQKGYGPREIPVYLPNFEEKTIRVGMYKSAPPMWDRVTCFLVIP